MFEKILLSQLSNKIGKKIDAEELKFNQFTGEIEVRDLVVYTDMSGTQVLARLESGRAKLNVADMMQQKVNITSASIEYLSINKPQSEQK